jgi:RimJ/RimL family protein N-acetyltransferase
MFSIVEAGQADCQFIHEILEALRGGLLVKAESFETYFMLSLQNPCLKYLMGVNENGQKIGLITLNRFEIPRYIGHGYEMEEVIILDQYKGKGYSKKMIELVIERCKREDNCRKLIVKTDGEIAGSLYKKYMDQTSLISFQLYINKV